MLPSDLAFPASPAPTPVQTHKRKNRRRLHQKKRRKQKTQKHETKKMARSVPTTALLKGTLTFSAPLILTTLYHQPYLTTCGILLQYFLALRTYNPLQNSSTINQSLETSAIRSLVTTSTTNRTTRLLLGTVHILAAISLASRSQIHFNSKIFAARKETARGEITTTSQSPLMAHAARWGWQVLTMGGTLMLTTTAAIWLSSGYYGQ